MMKRTMVAAAVAVLMVPAMASAQTGSVTATATVGEHMTITGTGDLAFGTLDTETDNVLDPTLTGVVRTVSFNTDVTVSFDDVPTSLEGAASGYDLPVSLTCAWDMFDDSWSATSACSAASFDMDVGSALTTARLGFGGTITAADAAAAIADTYSAVMTMVVVGR